MFQPWENCLVDAKDPVNNTVGQIPTIQCIFPLFHNVVNAALLFGAVVALIFIIWGGIKLLRSQGDQKQVQSGRQTITYALIGLIIVFLSFFVINFIAVITGVTCIKNFSFESCKTGNPPLPPGIDVFH